MIDLTSAETEIAPATLPQLGLRIQNLTLAQDPGSAQLQRDTLPINEHPTLYNNDEQSDAPTYNRQSAIESGHPLAVQANHS